MSFRSQIAGVRRYAVSSLHKRTSALGELGPVVSFTFDDFPRSAFTVGSPLIERYGARATYYVAMGLMGKANRLGEQFLSSDVHQLVERGHEAAIHGFSHLSARKSPLEAFIRDVNRGNDALRRVTRNCSSGNFAYPYGEVTLSLKGRLGPQMASCRGAWGGFNGPAVDLNLLCANSLYGGLEQAESIRRLIRENEQSKGWLIFYTHDVADHPSPFGCTPALFEFAVSMAAGRGAKIMTVADVVCNLK